MSLCALCGLEVSQLLFIEKELRFCCKGCQVVFSILSTQKIKNYQTHPLFLQAVQAGLISNPLLLEHLEKRVLPDAELQKFHCEINGLWCPACAEVIALFLLQLEGIKSCIVDYATDIACIEFYPQILSKEKIFATINALGYEAGYFKNGEKKIDRSLWLRLAMAIFCAMNIMMFSYPIYSENLGIGTEGYSPMLSWLSFVTVLPVISYCCWPIWRSAWAALRVAFFGMESLVILGMSAAFIVSFVNLWRGDATHVYFDTLSMLIVFVLLGKMIELKAKFSSRNALLYIERSLPRKARKHFPNEELHFVPLKDVNLGDRISVYAGEKIPVDGFVVAGSALCDESVISGEALPVLKSLQSKVISGSIVSEGNLVLQTTATIEETTLKKIVDLVKIDIESKKIAFFPFVDRIVKIFVPIVFAIAASVFAWMYYYEGVFDQAILRVMSVFLIACPCAIGIATPMAESLLLSQMMKRGAIIRNRRALFLLGQEDVFIFDKTGTLTQGNFAVIAGLELISQEKLAILKALTSRSNHPICIAISQHIDNCCVEMQNIKEVLGCGLEGVYGDSIYRLGSFQWMQQHDIACPPPLIQTVALASSVYFAENQQLVSVIKLEDQLRMGVKELIGFLPREKMILSGDSTSATASAAVQAGITVWQGECSSSEKRALILKRRGEGKIVAMVGDGINDAPALAAADIGISMVDASEISIHVSDILLTHKKITLIADLRHLAIRGRAIIKQNLFWAFFYNVCGIFLAAYGVLTPLIAAGAMALSSLMVIANSYRLKFTISRF